MQTTVLTSVTSQLLVANATALVSTTAKTIVGSSTTTFLNPGTWLLSGMVSFILAATTTTTVLAGGFSTTTNTIATGEDTGLTSLAGATLATGAATYDLVVMPYIVTVLAQGATYFLVARATFATSTMTACGTLNAIQISP